MKNTLKNKNKNLKPATLAFTLVELLSVIGILGIICLIATPIVLGIMEETKKDVFYTSVLSLVNATKMDIGNKYYEEKFTYTLKNGVIDNIEFPVSNAEGMYGMIEYDEDSKVQYAVHNGKYCIKKMDYMDKAKIFNYEGICDFSTSEKCFAFSNGTITDYYEYENNNENNDICPRKVIIPQIIDRKLVTIIGDNAFEEKGLISVSFPSTIKTIANHAFDDNKLSGKLDLSHLINLTGIGNRAFAGLIDGSTNQITELILPSSITNIGISAFECNKLSGELDLSHLTGLTLIRNYAFAGSSDGSTNQISSIKLPSSVTSIGYNAFEYNKLSGELDLSYLTDLINIGQAAFAGDVNGNTNRITSIKLPSSVTSIGSSAFRYNKLSGELDLSQLINLTTIGAYVFQGSNDGSTNQITSIKFPSSVTSIGRDSFVDNKLSGELDLSYLMDLTSIGVRAFKGSSDGKTNQITSIKLPSSVTSIGQDGFSYNKLSGELDLSHLTGLTTIGSHAFAGSSDGSTNQISSIKLPSSVTSIGYNAFEYNKLSGELDLSHLTGLTTIGSYAFAGNQLTKLNFPNNVASIGFRAFQNNLFTTIIIPSSVTSIDGQAFNGNPLTQVIIYGKTSLSDFTSVGNAVFGFNNPTIQFVN